MGSLISKLPLETPVCKSEHETDDVSLLVVRAGGHQFRAERAKGSMFLTNGLYKDKSLPLTIVPCGGYQGPCFAFLRENWFPRTTAFKIVVLIQI